jgi:release factor glutamine methyltransferase
MIAEGRRELDGAEISKAEALIVRRLAGEPVGRILGRREFWGMEFLLGPETLEPRPDTETLVEAVLEFIEAGPGRTAPLRLADLGTGTGCLLVALLSELPQATGVGTDISEAAIAIARGNAAANGVGPRVSFLSGNWGEPLSGGYDVIVCNPPYITTSELGQIEREVVGFDPIVALDGGVDGLDAYCEIAADARRVLRPGGCLAVELGAGQRAAVNEIASSEGLASAFVRSDLGGIERALVMTVS